FPRFLTWIPFLFLSDFDLSDALGDNDQKPTKAPRKPSDDGGAAGSPRALSSCCSPSADLSLAALEAPGPVTKIVPKPWQGNGFNLEDALGGGGGGHDAPALPNEPKPRPNQPGSSGGFSDSDLLDGTSGGEGHGGGSDGGNPRNEGQDSNSEGVVPGIVGAVVVAVAGAISSFIAYQKKKLCFKENAGQGEVDLENRAGTNAEPPVQRTLLEK
uniref:CD99 antigen n=1 Tax=Ictidomys tridecemlineatus TaxID=43179 RepID=UPI001AA004DD